MLYNTGHGTPYNGNEMQFRAYTGEAIGIGKTHYFWMAPNMPGLI